MSFYAAPVPSSRTPKATRGVKCFTLRCIEIHLKTIFLSGHLHKTQHTHTESHSNSKQWSEVNLLDILYALNARRTSSSSAQWGASGSACAESIKCVFCPLSGLSTSVPGPWLMKWLLFVCQTLTGSMHGRITAAAAFFFFFLPPCIFVAFNFSLIVKIFILICAFCTFCLVLCLTPASFCLANLALGVG